MIMGVVNEEAQVFGVNFSAPGILVIEDMGVLTILSKLWED